MSGLHLPNKILGQVQQAAEKISGHSYEALSESNQQIRETCQPFQDYEGNIDSFLYQWQNDRKSLLRKESEFLIGALKAMENLPRPQTERQRQQLYRSVKERAVRVDRESVTHDLATHVVRQILHSTTVDDHENTTEDDDEESFEHGGIRDLLDRAAMDDRLAAAHEMLLQQYLADKMSLVGRLLAQYDSGSRDESNELIVKSRAFYECQDKTRNCLDMWCPITKTWWPSINLKTAHIVPSLLGDRTAAYMFGMDPDFGAQKVIFNERNMISTCIAMKNLLDQYSITFIPIDEHDYELFVLDDHTMETQMSIFGPEGGIKRIGDFHRTRLGWRNGNRPSRAFMFWHFLFSIKRCHFEWEFDRTNMVLRMRNGEEIRLDDSWASPGGYLRRSVIEALARREGFKGMPEEFWAWAKEHELESALEEIEELEETMIEESEHAIENTVQISLAENWDGDEYDDD